MVTRLRSRLQSRPAKRRTDNCVDSPTWCWHGSQAAVVGDRTNGRGSPFPASDTDDTHRAGFVECGPFRRMDSYLHPTTNFQSLPTCFPTGPDILNAPFCPTLASSETRSRSVYPSPQRAVLPSPGWRSFFKSHLGLQILLRVVGSRLQPGHSKLAQPSAHGLLAHRHRPSRGDLFAKVDTSPTHHPVPLWIRPLEHDGFQFLPAGLIQSRWAARAGPRSQPCHAIGVEAMNPVPQRLPRHAVRHRRASRE